MMDVSSVRAMAHRTLAMLSSSSSSSSWPGSARETLEADTDFAGRWSTRTGDPGQ